MKVSLHIQACSQLRCCAQVSYNKIVGQPINKYKSPNVNLRAHDFAMRGAYNAVDREYVATKHIHEL
jgi:hypothetical protein